MKCIIIEDEPLAIELLEDHISKIDHLELLDSFTNPIDAIHFLKNNKVDLIFLDVQMPELTGMQFLKIIDKNNISIILTTAYEQYALEAFELDVVDYLLKPISFERFVKSIGKIQKTNTKVSETVSKDYIFVKSEYKMVKIKLDEVLFLKGMADYVVFQMKDKKILTLGSLKSFETELPSDQFMRVHKSYIIPFEKIEHIERNRILINGEYIPVGLTYQDGFWEVIGKGK